MTKNSNKEMTQDLHFYTMKKFPNVLDDKINVIQFLEATSDLLILIDQLGNMFAPVKYDMQGNVDKIKKFYTYNENTCLLALMLNEKSSGKDEGAEGVLWLNRSILFFELVFEEIVLSLQRKETDASIKTILTKAYNGSVKRYHNWVTQKLFTIILNISPSLPQIIKLLDPTQNMEEFEKRLIELHSCLKIIRCRIDTFFIENNLFIEKK